MKTAEAKPTAKQAARTEQPFFNKGGYSQLSNERVNEHGYFLSAKQNPFFTNNKPIQAKLTIGSPNDKYEREADHVADKVVQRLNKNETASPQIQTGLKVKGVQAKPLAPVSPITPLIQAKCASCEQEEKLQKKEEDKETEAMHGKLQKKPIFDSNAEPPPGENTSIQRKCAECEKEEKLQKRESNTAGGLVKPSLQLKPIFESNARTEEKVQRKCATCEEEHVHKKESSSSTQTATPSVESSLSASKGSGSPLPESTRSQMESSIGADFSGVRIHNDSSSAQLSNDLHAQAFTHGNDIYFNSGKYDTSSSSGKHLLAHELTHVVQQNTSDSIHRKSPSGDNTVKEHGDIDKKPGSLLCPIATTSPTDEQRTRFAWDSPALSDLTLKQIHQFISDWHAKGANASVRLDGYASIEGPDDYNWILSCKRVVNIRKEMAHPSNGAPGIPDNFIAIYAHGETNRFSQTDLRPNRTVTITSVIPVRPTPVPPAVLSKKEFIVTVKSYIAPIGMRTGFIFCPSLLDLASVGPNVELRALGIATDLAYSEGPASDAKDKKYRLFSSRKFTVFYNSTSIIRVIESPLDTDTGKEGPLQPPALIITTDSHARLSPTSYIFRWAGKGRPHLLAEPAFQLVCNRVSVYIWHDLTGTINLVSGVPEIAGLRLLDSKFPSDRVFVNGAIHLTHPQDLFKQLWVSDPADPFKVE